MTYFHINLDPRGKKKSFAANSYTRDYIGFVFLFVCTFLWFFLFSLSGLSKTRLQGGAWEITLQLEAPGCHLWASGFRLRRPADSPRRGGLPSSSACTVTFFFFFLGVQC